jgi:hypothetical protein
MWITANTQVLGVADQGFHAPPQVVPPSFRGYGILDQQLRRSVKHKKKFINVRNLKIYKKNKHLRLAPYYCSKFSIAGNTGRDPPLHKLSQAEGERSKSTVPRASRLISNCLAANSIRVVI